MEINHPDTTLEAQQSEWKSDTSAYFTERGFDQASIEVGMQWGIDWFLTTQAKCLEVEGATHERIDDLELGKIINDAFSESHELVRSQIEERGLRFPGPSGVIWPTVYGVTKDTFLLAFGPHIERGRELLRLGKDYLDSQKIY